jgi:hypothetical protein
MPGADAVLADFAAIEPLGIGVVAISTRIESRPINFDFP